MQWQITAYLTEIIVRLLSKLKDKHQRWWSLINITLTLCLKLPSASPSLSFSSPRSTRQTASGWSTGPSCSEPSKARPTFFAANAELTIFGHFVFSFLPAGACFEPPLMKPQLTVSTSASMTSQFGSTSWRPNAQVVVRHTSSAKPERTAARVLLAAAASWSTSWRRTFEPSPVRWELSAPVSTLQLTGSLSSKCWRPSAAFLSRFHFRLRRRSRPRWKGCWRGWNGPTRAAKGLCLKLQNWKWIGQLFTAWSLIGQKCSSCASLSLRCPGIVASANTWTHKGFFTHKSDFDADL